MKEIIFLSKSEIQSGFDRVKFAEGLIRQLPKEHDGRNTWLMNYGISDEAKEIRKKYHKPLVWNANTSCLNDVSSKKGGRNERTT